jgi:DNA-directed RNA polymerase subunit M/transcription elongation factor TFIIS
VQITCPACKSTLTVRPQVRDRWLTCPRCLTQLMNPNPATQQTASRPASEAIQATPATAPASEAIQATPAAPVADRGSPSRCPGCGDAVEARWTYCPHCNERLSRRQRRPAPVKAEVDIEVRQDARATKIGLTVFLVLVLVGLIGFATFGGFQSMNSSPEAGTVLCIMAVVVSLLIAGCLVGMTRTKSSESKVLYGVLGGVSVMLVIVVGAVLLAFFAISAACANCGKLFRN